MGIIEMVMIKKTRKLAIWTTAYPDQAKALHPERSRAGGVKARSASEEVRMAIYRPIAEMFKREHPCCVVCVEMERYGATSDIHHQLGRDALLLFDIRHWLPVCRFHHAQIHDNPAWAKENGYTKITTSDSGNQKTPPVGRGI